MWSAVFLLAVAGTVFSEPTAIFPEDAVRMSGSRIVSGWEAEVGQFPHQVGLRTVTPAGRVFGCGGTVISTEWALTAAHCTAGGVTIVLRIGATNMTQPALMFETTKYYNHPLYNEATPLVVQRHDIGLIEFGRSISFGELIQPIRIQASFAKDKNYEGMQAIASGWGATWTQGSSPDVLNWVYLRLISNEECRRAFFWSSIIAPSTICTRGYQISSQSTCQLIYITGWCSGGPLTVIDEDGVLTQVGVTSFVHGAGCHAGQPAGFIRPGHYHDWFTEVTGINFDWDLDLEEPATSEAPEDLESDEPATSEAPGDLETDEPATSEAPKEPETDEPEADGPSAESEEPCQSAPSSESVESSQSA